MKIGVSCCQISLVSSSGSCYLLKPLKWFSRLQIFVMDAIILFTHKGEKNNNKTEKEETGQLCVYCWINNSALWWYFRKVQNLTSLSQCENLWTSPLKYVLGICNKMVHIPATSIHGVPFKWELPVLSITFHVWLYYLETCLECHGSN